MYYKVLVLISMHMDDISNMGDDVVKEIYDEYRVAKKFSDGQFNETQELQKYIELIEIKTGISFDDEEEF